MVVGEEVIEQLDGGALSVLQRVPSLQDKIGNRKYKWKREENRSLLNVCYEARLPKFEYFSGRRRNVRLITCMEWGKVSRARTLSRRSN